MTEIKTPLKAIRAKCLECCGDNSYEVKHCDSKLCPLVPFRFGKNPYVKREMTDEQRKELSERMKKARKAKNPN